MTTINADHAETSVLPFVLSERAEPTIRPYLSRPEARLLLHALTKLRIDNMKSRIAGSITDLELDERNDAITDIARKLGAS